MDPRRFVNAAVVAVAIGCGATPVSAASPVAPDGARPLASAGEPRPYVEVVGHAAAEIAPPADRVEGAVQVFGWSPGRVYAVRAAPLRVTTLTLAPGETLMAKAAGDTVRWQLGEARSGVGTAGRTHVLIKPIARGLETNLVLTTDQRVYLILLRSGPVERFNAGVTWEIPVGSVEAVRSAPVAADDATPAAAGGLDARYRIEIRGRRPAWAPSAVFDDGRRTFIVFPAAVRAAETPALFVIGADGEAQFVNYRQSDGLYIADRLFDRAELRLGDRRPQIVRLRRLAGDAR